MRHLRPTMSSGCTNDVVVPEPSTFALLFMGVAVLAGCRRRIGYR